MKKAPLILLFVIIHANAKVCFLPYIHKNQTKCVEVSTGTERPSRFGLVFENTTGGKKGSYLVPEFELYPRFDVRFYKEDRATRFGVSFVYHGEYTFHFPLGVGEKIHSDPVISRKQNPYVFLFGSFGNSVPFVVQDSTLNHFKNYHWEWNVGLAHESNGQVLTDSSGIPSYISNNKNPRAYLNYNSMGWNYWFLRLYYHGVPSLKISFEDRLYVNQQKYSLSLEDSTWWDSNHKGNYWNYDGLRLSVTWMSSSENYCIGGNKDWCWGGELEIRQQSVVTTLAHRLSRQSVHAPVQSFIPGKNGMMSIFLGNHAARWYLRTKWGYTNHITNYTQKVPFSFGFGFAGRISLP